MFKKDPRIKALSNLKNSDRKKLLRSLREQLHLSDDFPLALPDDAEIKQTNFTSQHAMGTIYTNAKNIPVVFKEKNKDTLYPTTYACWANPGLLPVVRTHDLVIEHLYNGANLMVAGTLPPFDKRLVPGTVCQVVNYTNPQVAIAVGVVDMDLASMDKVAGVKGVAVEIMHHFEDRLMPEFKVKLEMPKGEAVSAEEEAGDEASTANDEQAETVEADNAGAGSPSPVEDLAEVLDKLSVEDVDHFITRSLYYTIVTDDKVELPINASNFIANHIMHNLPEVDHNEVNIKKSSWKKSAKFLKHFEKLGFLKLKGKGDNLVVVGFNKDKDELKHFNPYKIGSGSSKSKGSASNADGKSEMGLVTLYKPINKGKTLLESVGQPSDRYFTSQEIRDALHQYIDAHKLVNEKNKKMIMLDDLLFNMVNIKKSQAADAPRIIARSALQPPVLKNNFTEAFQLYKDNGETPVFKKPLKGALPRVKVVTEMKIGRKIVTRVSNFEVFQITPEGLAADLRKICSGSTTIGETMTSPKTAEVQVQGPHGTLIIEHLKTLGVPNKWIDFKNKVKSKKKR